MKKNLLIGLMMWAGFAGCGFSSRIDYRVKRPRLEVTVRDAATHQRIPHALLSMWYEPVDASGSPSPWRGMMQGGGTYETGLANPRGTFVFPEKQVKVKHGIGEGHVYPPIQAAAIRSKHLAVWFPGYKKKEVKVWGDEEFPVKLIIALERPKTAEEAVTILYSEMERALGVGAAMPAAAKTEHDKLLQQSFVKACIDLIRFFGSRGETRCLGTAFKMLDYGSVGDEIFASLECSKLKNKDYRGRCEKILHEN